MIKRKISQYIMFLLITILLLSIFCGCAKNNENIGVTSAQLANVPPLGLGGDVDTEGTNYLNLYEGLHITGNPIDVDIKTYRLKVSGIVDKELNLTFDDIKNMKSVKEEIELVCPGFFIDNGYWTGVRVIDLLNLAGIKKEAKNVKFISIDGSYTQTLSIEKVKGDGFLIAYQFNDKEFSKYHGYPLRLVVKGEAGSYWVKWLGEINIF